MLPDAQPSRRRRLPSAALGLAAGLVIFVWGVLHLLQLRFEVGDVYPPYSTLRSDPLGAAAFYEALESQPGLRVERSLRSLDRLGRGPVTPFVHAPPPDHPAATGTRLTCFYLGADPYAWPTALGREEAETLSGILRGGGRVVMTFLPADTPLTAERLRYNRRADDPPPGATAPRKGRSARENRQLEALRPADLVWQWGIDFKRLGARDGVRAAIPNLARDPFALPTPPPGGTPAPVSLVRGQTAVPKRDGPLADAGSVPWHTVLDFDLGSPAAHAAGWHALYLRDMRPVIVARPFGTRGGELILASDSYFLSNEALRADPRPALLAALVGDGQRLVFDESHHGLHENPGLMTLARRYGLQGALAAVGLLVALFIWRNVLSLVPPPPASAEAVATTATVPGRAAAAGFLNLLRRGVPPRDLLATCLAQWQTGTGRRPPDAATVERLRALASEQATRPAAAYRAMCAAAKPGK